MRTPHRFVFVAPCALTAILVATGANAGQEKITFPAHYVTDFVRYATVDKPERTPSIVRFLYVNPGALAAAKAEAALPDGTVLVMEDHEAALDAEGKAVMGPGGRLVPTSEVGNVFVQEKRAGWGAEYPAELRNGTWEYAQFRPDGTLKADAKIERCFECHKQQEAADFNFTFSPFVAEMKP